MGVMRKYFALHTSAGAVAVLEGSTVSFDRGWMPQGSASLVLPMGDPVTASLQPGTRQRVNLVYDAWQVPYVGPLGSGSFTGTNLGNSSWPMEQCIPYFQTHPGTHYRFVWPLIVDRGRRDHVQRTYTVELSTPDSLLQSVWNGFTPWFPPATSGVYSLRNVAEAMAKYARIPLTFSQERPTTIEESEIVAWETGEAAGDYLEKMRAAAEVVHIFDPVTQTIMYNDPLLGGSGAGGPGGLDTFDDVGGTDYAEYNQFADALAITWQWEETSKTGESIQQEQTRIYLAKSVKDWRDAKRMVTMDKEGKPQHDWAQNYVNERSQWRILRTIDYPLEWYVPAIDSADTRAYRITLGSAPIISLTQISYEGD